MRNLTLLGAAAVAALLLVPMTACAASTTADGSDASGTSTATGSSESSQTDAPIGGDIVAPNTVGMDELDGSEVALLVGQVLNITTGDVSVDSYSGEVEDSAVAVFTTGYSDGSAEFNPGVEALAAGSTRVTITGDGVDVRPVTFTVVVTDAR